MNRPTLRVEGSDTIPLVIGGGTPPLGIPCEITQLHVYTVNVYFRIFHKGGGAYTTTIGGQLVVTMYVLRNRTIKQFQGGGGANSRFKGGANAPPERNPDCMKTQCLTYRVCQHAQCINLHIHVHVHVLVIIIMQLMVHIFTSAVQKLVFIFIVSQLTPIYYYLHVCTVFYVCFLF